MDNYQFCAQWVLAQGHGKNIRVLDYGCGTGKLIAGFIFVARKQASAKD